MRIEHLILKTLIENEEYVRKVIPFIKSEYFTDQSERALFNTVAEYIEKYNSPPSMEAIVIEIDNGNYEEAHFSDIMETMDDISSTSDSELPWLLDQTEKFCQERAIHNGLMESIAIMDSKDGSKDKGSIPDILRDALSVSFDSHVGHDFIDDAEKRYDFYNQKLNHIPFDIDLLNKITDGGFTNKTLNVLMSGTSGGKSLAMCHMAANNLSDGRNVLYITLEMAEEKIAKRIDANLFDIAIADIDGMVRGSYLRKVDQFASKTNGKLIVKEYPPTSAGANHFRHLLNELKLKRNFFPDIIYIDYLNLCVSSRFKNNSNMGPYQYVKAISEELRGLAIEYDFPVVSATQTNRGGYGNTDVGLEDVSESFGLPMTADIMMAVINNDEFKAEGKLLFKQLKNRDGDTTYHNSFFVGVDYSRMRLYDLDDQEQEQSTNEDRPIMDDTTFGKADFDRKKKRGFDFDKFK